MERDAYCILSLKKFLLLKAAGGARPSGKSGSAATRPGGSASLPAIKRSLHADSRERSLGAMRESGIDSSQERPLFVPMTTTFARCVHVGYDSIELNSFQVRASDLVQRCGAEQHQEKRPPRRGVICSKRASVSGHSVSHCDAV